MNTYFRATIERDITGNDDSSIVEIHAQERPLDRKDLLKDGCRVRYTAYFDTLPNARVWQTLMFSRSPRPIDFMDRRRINCNACSERAACDQAKADCPLDDPPAYPIKMHLPREIYVEYLSRVHGWPLRIRARDEIAVLCDVHQLGAGKLAPIYRFPGGTSLVDDCEMIPYDDERS